jgi:hypothetical protein
MVRSWEQVKAANAAIDRANGRTPKKKVRPKSASGSDGFSELLRYDKLCARIYADERMPPGTRELALTLAWTALRDPERHNGEANVAAAARILGRDGREWRLRDLFARDVPRYEKPQAWAGPCDGPRLRPYVRRGYGYSDEEADRRTAGNTRCGDHAREFVHEWDMVTGQVSRTWWFCSRHQADRRRVQAQVAALGGPPPAIPNEGGLLPCYFQPTAVAWWYKEVRPWWEPPYHGICADDWPIPGQQPVPKRPRLALIIGELEE